MDPIKNGKIRPISEMPESEMPESEQATSAIRRDLKSVNQSELKMTNASHKQQESSTDCASSATSALTNIIKSEISKDSDQETSHPQRDILHSSDSIGATCGYNEADSSSETHPNGRKENEVNGTAPTDFSPLDKGNNKYQYDLVMSYQTMDKAKEYLENIKKNRESMGQHLKNELSGVLLDTLTPILLIRHLLATKKPKIFAEKAIQGDGSDWTQDELSILGDLGVAVDVDIFDDGIHVKPNIHDKPFQGTLLYIPGALLASKPTATPADLNEVVQNDKVHEEKLYQLYLRRLLPLFKYVNKKMETTNQKAFITLPGFGTGCFAGKYKDNLKQMLGNAIEKLIKEHPFVFTHISAVYYDPYEECVEKNITIGKTEFMIKPFNSCNKSQLCPPSEYSSKKGKIFSDHKLFSFVAWDHVSWPGNDFYKGQRKTDDGVKAAATNSMSKMTNHNGHYDRQQYKYIPENFNDWDAVIQNQKIKFGQDENLYVL